MKELNIVYGEAKFQKWLSVFLASIFAVCYFGWALKEYMTIPDGEELGYFFYCYLIIGGLFLLAALYNYFYDRAVRVQINEEQVFVKIPSQKKVQIEWVRVSKVELNTSSIGFHLDGGTSVKNLKYIDLRYKDVPAFKQVIKDLCDTKNIPTKGF